MQKRYTLNDFINPKRKSEQTKKLLKMTSSGSSGKRGPSNKQRTPEETKLLLKTIMRDIQKQQQEGNLIKNGRQWKYHF